jgi:single-strand DNA-binding protein
VATSVDKGQRVIVTGRVRIRDWESGAKSGTTIEIDADAIGHDLTWGRATFTRSIITAKPGSTGSEASGSDFTVTETEVNDADEFASGSQDDDQALDADDEAEFSSAGASRPF